MELPEINPMLVQQWQSSGSGISFGEWLKNNSSESPIPMPQSAPLNVPMTRPEPAPLNVPMTRPEPAPNTHANTLEPGAVQSHPEPRKIPEYRPPKTSDNMYIKMREDMKKRQQRPPQSKPMQQSRPLQKMASSGHSAIKHAARDAVLQKRKQYQEKIDSAQSKTDNIQAAISKLRSNR